MILKVNNISSGYGKIDILHGVSMHIEESEIVSIIGPNGAGKSTVLKTIMGFLKPTEGNIVYDGEDITGLRTDLLPRRGISYTPQGRVVFPHMTALENLEMGAYIEKSKQKIKESLERAYEIFPVLKERRDQMASTMSGGEQQMLAMARGLMINPRLVLLDEPSLGLAPKYVKMIFEKIAEMKEAGLTVMLVEQNAASALEVADRGYVIELGRNRFEGDSKDLLNNKEVRQLYLGG